MALKSKVEDISELPEGLAEFYTQAEGGGYELAVEGMVPKKSLDEFRDTNIKLQKDLAKLSKTFSNVDLEEYKSLKQREQAEKDQELISAGKVDELVLQRTERLRSDLESQMKQFEEQAKDSAARAARAEQERDSYLINTRLQQAAATAGVRDTAVPDVLNRAQAV
ncbi:MAG: hypothetical protein ACPGC3_01480 [Paracoccaceae bacterium]